NGSLAGGNPGAFVTMRAAGNGPTLLFAGGGGILGVGGGGKRGGFGPGVCWPGRRKGGGVRRLGGGPTPREGGGAPLLAPEGPGLLPLVLLAFSHWAAAFTWFPLTVARLAGLSVQQDCPRTGERLRVRATGTARQPGIAGLREPGWKYSLAKGPAPQENSRDG